MNNSQCFRTIKLFDGFEVEFSARLRLVYNCWFVLFAKTSEGPDGLVWENQGPGSRDWKNSIVNIASTLSGEWHPSCTGCATDAGSDPVLGLTCCLVAEISPLALLAKLIGRNSLQVFFKSDPRSFCVSRHYTNSILISITGLSRPKVVLLHWWSWDQMHWFHLVPRSLWFMLSFFPAKKRGHIWDIIYIMAYGCVLKMRIPIKLFFNAENDNYIRSITFWGTLFSDNPICVDHPEYIYILDGMNQPYLLRATLGLWFHELPLDIQRTHHQI